MGRENEHDLFLYREGLLVYFEPSGWNAQSDGLHAAPAARPDRRAAAALTSPRTGIATQSGRLFASYTTS